MDAREKNRELIVVGTVSSGKSTFINALIGESLLPSRNQVCTGHNLSIVFDKYVDSMILKIKSQNEEYEFKDAVYEKIEEYNNRNDLTEMEVLYPVKNKSVSLPIKITDTPGGNACGHQIHREIAKSALQKDETGITVYIMNTEVLFTEEDKEYLNEVLQKQENRKIIFILNKIDELDPDRESVQEIISNSVNYLKQAKIDAPVIYPCAGRAALILKKALYGKELTKDETRKLSWLYDMFINDELNLNYKSRTPIKYWLKRSLKINGKLYKPRKLYKALVNTGLIAFEEDIYNLLKQI